uniref:TsaA-like domain-containing protein n=1 Tax=Globisporangium ultimum (strain ATCC 200006 / CBS 805.95 / DAOM BR144) TaxID=431595 RepID=K3X2B7_GLOUD
MLGNWLAALVATGAACTAAGFALGRQQQASAAPNKTKDEAIAELQREVARQKTLRAQERSGRTNAERDAREAIQRHQELHGYTFDAIGAVESCFAERRGTPRQGALVPDARARIAFRTSIPPASLEGLEQFTHLWVIFVFHENTNVAKASSSSGAKKTTTFPAKIAPPRLGGKKVGLFSTRTPHRPNSIGLTVVKIDAVHERYIDISGHDLVHGTPVLDVKPYVPADCVADHVCPEWVSEKSDVLVRIVEFSDEATQALATMIERQQSTFYKSVDDIQAAIKQMLVLDIRSVHQGRGHASEEQVFLCRFDNVQIEFKTFEEKILVTQCSYSPTK